MAPHTIQDFLHSIKKGISQETEERKRRGTQQSLDIEGIRCLSNIGNSFVYRILLSNAINLSAEQTLRFRIPNTNSKVTATVISCDDDGIIIESDKPLPTDAKLTTITFEPTFIYQALDEYLSQAHSTGKVASEFLEKKLVPLPNHLTALRKDLNDDQSLAVDNFSAVPISLLWGPPGTGKTTTLGAAVAEWLRQGKSVLVTTTSNSAVDIAMRSILKYVKPHLRSKILRLGSSLDPEVHEITIAGKLREFDPTEASRIKSAQDRLTRIADQISHRTLSNERFQKLLSEHNRLESVINQANEKLSRLLRKKLPKALVLGCTLAKMVLEKAICDREFDIVVVDEASMVPVIYAMAAATLAKKHLILAGDPKQLPPICTSTQAHAREWFARNCYDWFGVIDEDQNVDRAQFSMLRTQYRMTDEIGNMVSRFSYGGELRHGRKVKGKKIRFIELPDEWHTTYYSVTDSSYFHLSSIPIIQSILGASSDGIDTLLLSPFRAQRSLQAALALDMQAQSNNRKVVASTIHRSQGSESPQVILDLTTHQASKLVAFFKDESCENLFNVAISRAKDELIIIGSLKMLQELAKDNAFWRRVALQANFNMNVIPAVELLKEKMNEKKLISFFTKLKNVKGMPAIYCHSKPSSSLNPMVGLLREIDTSCRLLVLPKRQDLPKTTDLLVRRNDRLPPVFVAKGYIALPFSDEWVLAFSPNVTRVLWRTAFSHQTDEEVNPLKQKRFFCAECATGEMVLKRVKGEGWFLVCSNKRSFECTYIRRLTLNDAILKVKFGGMKCPDGHPLTARQGSQGIFIACENYPDCEFSERLSVLEGC